MKSFAGAVWSRKFTILLAVLLLFVLVGCGGSGKDCPCGESCTQQLVDDDGDGGGSYKEVCSCITVCESTPSGQSYAEQAVDAWNTYVDPVATPNGRLP